MKQFGLFQVTCLSQGGGTQSLAGFMDIHIPKKKNPPNSQEKKTTIQWQLITQQWIRLLPTHGRTAEFGF